MARKMGFILLLLIVNLIVFSFFAQAIGVEVYLRKATSHYRAIFFATALQSKYIHAGLKVGKWAISAGPNGIDLKLADFNNAIYIETSKESNVRAMYEQAVNLFNKFGFASYGDYLKVFFNRAFNTDLVIEGMTCTAFVAHMLDMKNPQDKIPSDFLKLKGDKK